MHLYGGALLRVCMGLWRSKVDIKRLPQSHPTSFIGAAWSWEPGAGSLELGSGGGCVLSGFLVGAGGLNTSPHMCSSNTLHTTGPFPPSLVLVLRQGFP